MPSCPLVIQWTIYFSKLSNGFCNHLVNNSLNLLSAFELNIPGDSTWHTVVCLSSRLQFEWRSGLPTRVSNVPRFAHLIIYQPRLFTEQSNWAFQHVRLKIHDEPTFVLNYIGVLCINNSRRYIYVKQLTPRTRWTFAGHECNSVE